MVFTLQDLQTVATFARARGIKTIIDNTWATPLFQKPLALGVDLEVHSCSKYLGGHSDIVLGAIVGSATAINSILLREHAWYGAKTAPFEAWLLTRSLRTLNLRMHQHQKSALAVANLLNNHLDLFSIGVSWGGHESLIIAPAVPYSRELTPDKIKALGINIGDIRLSIGLEDTDDLLTDIEAALAAL